VSVSGLDPVEDRAVLLREVDDRVASEALSAQPLFLVGDLLLPSAAAAAAAAAAADGRRRSRCEGRMWETEERNE